MPRFDYLLPNPHIMRYQRATQLRVICIVLFSMCALLLNSQLPFLGAVLALFVSTDDPIRAAGAEGEQLALGQTAPKPGSLGTLPVTYTVFNNLLIPHRGRLCELDLIVVGPRGVFVVEVKHYAGRLAGEPRDAHWRQTTRRGTKTMPNPLRQLARQVDALTTLLRRQGYDGAIQGLVVMTHPNVELALGSSHRSVVRLDNLADQITHWRPQRIPRAPGLPTVVLKEIRAEMRTPPGPFSWLKCYHADLTGRRPWMRDFRPTPFPRYFMRDQCRTRMEQFSE